MNTTIKTCRKQGFVTNIFGRRIHLRGINDKNFSVRAFQERAAINAPIQGSASEIMRLAMIRLDKKLSENKISKPKMLLQIHDELIFEVPKKDEKLMTKIIKNEMTSVAQSDFHSFSTPLTVDVNVGDNWGMLH
jgi:DNA polymerase-1